MRKKSVDPNSEDPFPDLAKNAFPQKLTPKHLPKLNEAFEDLAQSLRLSLSLYKQGNNSGRDGATACLIAINMFMMSFEILDAEHLNTPLNSVIIALSALNQNNQLPILTPVPSTGRAKSSAMRDVLEGWAVITVESIMVTGTPLDKACEIVASHLDKAGIKSSRGNAPISGRTVRNWKQRASEDVAMRGIMAQSAKMFRDFIKADDSGDGISIEEALEGLDIFLSMEHPSNFR